MKQDIERNLGPQPIAQLLETLAISSHELVEASTEHITHKMVSRACKGRRLTRNVQHKLLRALNTKAEATHAVSDLFNY
jgi:hypothetical protein